MATWNPPSDSVLTQDKAIIDLHHRQIRDLTISAFEGASGAARLAVKMVGGSSSGTTPLAITGLGDFQGVTIDYTAYNSGGTNRVPTIALSDDGVTYGSTTNLPQIDASENGIGKLYIDFATGGYRVIWGDSSSADHATGTIAGGGASVSAFRIVPATDITLSLMGWAHGGDSVT